MNLPPVPEGFVRISYMQIVRKTERALLIKFDDAEEHWVPKNACYLYANNAIDLEKWKFDEINTIT